MSKAVQNTISFFSFTQGLTLMKETFPGMRQENILLHSRHRVWPDQTLCRVRSPLFPLRVVKSILLVGARKKIREISFWGLTNSGRWCIIYIVERGKRSQITKEYGRLAQLVEHSLDVRVVSGSNPLASTKPLRIIEGVFLFRFVLLPS